MPPGGSVTTCLALAGHPGFCPQPVLRQQHRPAAGADGTTPSALHGLQGPPLAVANAGGPCTLAGKPTVLAADLAGDSRLPKRNTGGRKDNR